MGHDAGGWFFYALNGARYDCAPGDSTLVATWGTGGAGNASFSLCPNANNPSCQNASTGAGNGTPSSRAVNCVSPNATGVVGLQLTHQNGDWNYYDIAGTLNTCAPQSTLVSEWERQGTADVLLCDDSLNNGDPSCVAAAANGGSGTGRVRPLNCLHSAPVLGAHGAIGLHIGFENGRWFYYDVQANKHACLNGSVLVSQPTN